MDSVNILTLQIQEQNETRELVSRSKQGQENQLNLNVTGIDEENVDKMALIFSIMMKVDHSILDHVLNMMLKYLGSIISNKLIQSKLTNTTESTNLPFSRRYNLFPLQDKAAYDLYAKLESTFWVATELNYVIDKADYISLKQYDPTGLLAKMKRLIDHFLGFVLPADGLICENLIENFLKSAQTYEETIFFTCQIHNETIHAITYALVAQTLIPDANEQKAIFEMVDNLPCLQAKVQLMEKYKNGNWSRAERYVAFACAEGLFFTVLFNIIFWFKSKNMFKNLIDANRMINRDEARHREFGTNRYRRIPSDQKDAKRSLEIVQEFVNVERMFIEHMVPEPVEDLTKESLVLYLYNIADLLLVDLGLERYYWSDYVPEWLDISLEQKANFFEVSSTEYNHSSYAEMMNIDKLTGAHIPINPLNDPSKTDF